MKAVLHDSYLGDILSADRKSSLTIKDRLGKEMGKMTEILNTLYTVSFGVFYFKIFHLLREAVFVNGIMTNSEIWYGLEDNSLKELEDLDRMMIRKVFQCPFSIPKEAGHLELGFLPLSSIVKERRILYLHYLVKSDHSKMLYKFFIAQWEDESKNDWTKMLEKI